MLDGLKMEETLQSALDPAAPFSSLLGRAATPRSVCEGCQRVIADRFLLRLNDSLWHERCVQCASCKEPLHTTCFYRDKKLYCKLDYENQSTGVSWTAMLQKPEMEGDRCGHFSAIPGMRVSASAVGSRGLSPHSFLQEMISGSNRVAFPHYLLMLSCRQVVQRVQDVTLTIAGLCCAFMEAREPVVGGRGGIWGH
uniref:LIM zinc-binding domain-containing protein n=1 Tax=Pavo cristatus TaxID=9049 RepID=A0A8C9G619_PAVCR